MEPYIDLLQRRHDYGKSKTFEVVDALFPALQTTARYQAASLEEDRGSLSWGAAIVARSYLQMYLATSDQRYLRRYVGQIEQVLLCRDSFLGQSDYLGKVGDSWRSGRPYSTNIGKVPLVGSKGWIEVRAKGPQAVRISHTSGNTFALAFLGETGEEEHVFHELSLDPASNRYIALVFSQHGWRQPLPAVKLSQQPDILELPTAGTYDLSEQYQVSAVQTSQICTALLEFCVLHAEGRVPPAYAHFASRYQEAAECALAFHAEELRTVSSNLTLVVPNGSPSDFEGTDAPVNHAMSMARCYMQLSQLPGGEAYIAKGQALMDSFRKDLSVIETDGGDAYIWPYFKRSGVNFNGYDVTSKISDWRLYRHGNRRSEDASHAVIAVEAAVEATKIGLSFDEYDLAMFGQTFVSMQSQAHVQGRSTLSNYIDGTSGTGKYDSAAGRWAVLARWCPSVLSGAQSIMNTLQPKPVHATVLLSVASIVRGRAEQTKRPRKWM